MPRFHQVSMGKRSERGSGSKGLQAIKDFCSGDHCNYKTSFSVCVSLHAHMYTYIFVDTRICAYAQEKT